MAYSVSRRRFVPPIPPLPFAAGSSARSPMADKPRVPFAVAVDPFREVREVQVIHCRMPPHPGRSAATKGTNT